MSDPSTGSGSPRAESRGERAWHIQPRLASLARPAAAMIDLGAEQGQSATRDLNDFGAVVGPAACGGLETSTTIFKGPWAASVDPFGRGEAVVGATVFAPPHRGIVAAKAMPEYVIERDVPGAGQFTQEQIREVSLRSLEVLKGLGPQIQWLHSYVTDDRIYCVYLAPDEETVREHARQAGVPANRISMVRRLVDPKRYS